MIRKGVGYSPAELDIYSEVRNREKKDVFLYEKIRVGRRVV